MYDLLIKNGFIIDGTGSPGYHGDVAVKDGKIAKIKRRITDEAKESIDAAGLTVTPGFIDSHSHGDIILERYPDCRYKLEQGVTTEIVGLCGSSCAPISERYEEDGIKTNQDMMPGAAPDTSDHLRTFSEYMEYMGASAYGTNIAGYIGHNTIRIAVMGYEGRMPSEEELQQMKDYVKDAMEAGALGISLGTHYSPGSYSDVKEAIALCEVVVQYGGSLSVHMRSEDHKLLEGVAAVLELVRATGIPAVISHHKASGKPELCWGLPKQSLQMIEQANAEGYDVFIDQYPYTASATVMNSWLPMELHALGQNRLMQGFEDPDTRKEYRDMVLKGETTEEYFYGVMISTSESRPQYNGWMLLDAAKDEGSDPCDFLFDILHDDNMATGCINWRICEEDVKLIMQNPRVMVGTDGLMYPGCANCHPRSVASFPRVLGHYVREEKTLTLVDAVRKITGLPSMVYGLEGKGILRTGMDADITIFDADRIIDKADFKNCFLRCEGLSYVIVAGHIVVKDARYLGGVYGRMMKMNNN